MTPNTIIQGDALTVLKTLPDSSVNCCVNSGINPKYIQIAGNRLKTELGMWL
jgi:DNA modification methylase